MDDYPGLSGRAWSNPEGPYQSSRQCSEGSTGWVMCDEDGRRCQKLRKTSVCPKLKTARKPVLFSELPEGASPVGTWILAQGDWLSHISSRIVFCFKPLSYHSHRKWIQSLFFCSWLRWPQLRWPWAAQSLRQLVRRLLWFNHPVSLVVFFSTHWLFFPPLLNAENHNQTQFSVFVFPYYPSLSLKETVSSQVSCHTLKFTTCGRGGQNTTYINIRTGIASSQCNHSVPKVREQF